MERAAEAYKGFSADPDQHMGGHLLLAQLSYLKSLRHRHRLVALVSREGRALPQGRRVNRSRVAQHRRGRKRRLWSR